ncbi:MAG: SDR family oxidoreductase [Pseudomonadales bacterium]|nr:SDR family oxidoreductase [Pseudomonadales bacterium]MCP5184794.1 SDR family oxidoreductase [Pseudomonadales bacterium]
MIDWLKSGNCAVITGGGSGIGLAAAQRFLEAGMDVLIADANESALTQAEGALQRHGRRLLTQHCDVARLEDIQALKVTADTAFGRVDCLMNNAGAAVTRAAPWEDLAGWRRQLDINLWGIVQGCHVFVPDMLRSPSPVAVINTGSKQGITNPPPGYAYNLSKAGVVNYTQSLAHALRQIDQCPVSAHLLIPGFTYSGMIARHIPEKPAGAWSTDQVVDYLLDALARGDFCILCPDNDTPRELDARRIRWNADDLILNRPALSRWHPDHAQAYAAFVADVPLTPRE